MMARWFVLVLVACSAPAPAPTKPATTPTTPTTTTSVTSVPSPPDADGDKIADADDTCPNDAEIYNGTDDEDGCPDRECVLAKNYPLCIDERLYFAQNSAAIAPASAKLLDAIAHVLQEGSDDIQRVAVRGFRTGKEPFSLPLLRAIAVRDQLLERGLPNEMLELVDGGVAAPAQSPSGQQRVELEITKQRVAYEDADDIVCTGAGRWFVKLAPAERKARCEKQRGR